MTQITLNLVLQLVLTALTMATPIVTEGHQHNNNWQYGAGGGLVGFIILILDIIVWFEVLKSDRPVSHKLLWCILVFLFPIGGIIIYWLFSNRAAHNRGYEPIV